MEIACCSIVSKADAGGVIFEYLMALWIRNPIPHPIPPISRSSLTMLKFGVLKLLLIYSSVAGSAALCCSMNYTS